MMHLRELLSTSGLPADQQAISDDGLRGDIEAVRLILSQTFNLREVEGVVPDMESLSTEVANAVRGLVQRIASLSAPPRPAEILPQMVELFLQERIMAMGHGRLI